MHCVDSSQLKPITTIDYALAGEYANEVRAFASIESGEDSLAVGDAGQALGLVQLHPATFVHWYSRAAMKNSDTWTGAFIKTCAAFLDYFAFHEASPNQQDLIVQAWNLGVAGVFTNGRRNPEYLAKWKKAYQGLALPKSSSQLL